MAESGDDQAQVGTRLESTDLDGAVAAALARVGTTTLGDVLTWGPTVYSLLDDTGAGLLRVFLDRHGLVLDDGPSGPAWPTGMTHLLVWVAEHGHSAPPRTYVSPDGYRTGQWVMANRMNWAKGRLADGRARLLEQQPGWFWERGGAGSADAAALRALPLLREYVDREGHPNPGLGDVVGSARIGFLLRDKVRSQRHALSAEVLAQFDQIDGWTWSEDEAMDAVRARQKAAEADTVYPDWDARFEALAAFSRAHGHVSVPTEVVFGPEHGGGPVATWVTSLRVRRHLLNRRQEAMLESLDGWTWDGFESRSRKAWLDALTRLRTWVDEHGTADVPTSIRTADGFALGEWVRAKESERDVLSQEQQDALDALPGWTWRERERRILDPAYLAALQREFEAKADQVEAFVAAEGRMPRGGERNEFGFGLGQWVIDQRSLRRKGDLSDDRVARLEAIPGWVWNAPRGRSGKAAAK